MTIKTIKDGDPNFFVTDGVRVAARAAIEITPDCPRGSAELIHMAFREGWIRVIAHVPERELVWEALSQH